MHIRIVIQARVGSSRLPGKILAPLAGEPLLAHVVRRLQAAQGHTSHTLEICVATTRDNGDDATQRLCDDLGTRCFRGPTQDVLARYVEATSDLSPDDIVLRATADNPLYCPRRTVQILHEHLQGGGDYTCIRNLSYVVPEVMQVAALRAMAGLATEPYCREHVTPYFRQSQHAFRARQLPENWRGLRPDIRLTVDTAEELQRVEELLVALSRQGRLVALEEVYAYLDSRSHAPRGNASSAAPRPQRWAPACAPDLRVAVVGYGSIGRRHFHNLAALGVKNRLLVRRRENANAAFTVPPDAQVAHSNAEAIAKGIDLAILCNPTRLHVATARQYLEAGIAVLIEKPLCAVDDLKAAEQLLHDACRRRVPVGMAYCMRYHPAYRMAHQALTEGRIGRVLYAKAWFEGYLPDWHPWEDYRQSYAAQAELGGGAVPTLDHEIDFLNWCLGDPLEAAGLAVNSGALDIDANDHATLATGYASGATGTAVLSLCRRDRSRGFEFIGERGTLRFSMETTRLELVLSSGSAVLWHDPQLDFNQLYVDLLRDFLLAVHRERQPPIPLESGIAAARVIHMALSRGNHYVHGRAAIGPAPRVKYRQSLPPSTGPSAARGAGRGT
jgi:spore coat polysaccharide biosynthesis protein SpsF (cytidylyltransferase family)/predicted dehydrogenase